MGKMKPSKGVDFRRKAESGVNNKIMTEQPLSSGLDTVKLMHELEIHQIELELQNEELRQQRDRAEEAIGKYSDLYKEIYDFTPVAYFSFSREGLILQANLKASDLLGVSRDYIIDRNFRNFLTGYNKNIFNEFLNQVYSKPGKVRVEIQIFNSDHSRKYCILEGTLSENESKCLAMILDISDLKEMEIQLRNTQEKLKESRDQALQHLTELESIYRNVPAGLCVFDLNLNYLRINESMAQMNGFTVQDHIGKHISQIVPELAETAGSIVKRILETGEPQKGMVFTGTTPAEPDEIRSWSEDWSPIKDHEGRIIGINVAVLETTTETRAMEKLINNERKLTRAKKDLEQAQKKLNITLKNARIGTWEWDMRSDDLKFDKRTEEIFGLKPGTFGGTLADFEDLIHEDDLLHVKNAVASAMDGRPERTIYRTKPRKGNTNYISSSSVVVKDREGNPRTLYGVVFDITDMQEGTEQALIKMHEELTRSNNDLMQFAYIASHDLQEPLRMVTSFTQLLQAQYSEKLDQRANEYINYAVEGSKRMYELLNGLLVYSRIQSGRKGFEKINLEKVVQKARQNLKLLIDETGTDIHVDGLPQVNADENLMIQLFQNLIENSIKFCKSRPIIRISGTTKEGRHIISVQDNAIGIESQYFDRIFRIFQRLHPREEYKGTGIGLAICKKIVERHGGEIWVKSTPGEGSVFYFSIPGN